MSQKSVFQLLEEYRRTGGRIALEAEEKAILDAKQRISSLLEEWYAAKQQEGLQPHHEVLYNVIKEALERATTVEEFHSYAHAKLGYELITGSIEKLGLSGDKVEAEKFLQERREMLDLIEVLYIEGLRTYHEACIRYLTSPPAEGGSG